MSELIQRAREFAKQAHKGQLRKGTGIPYFMHLEETAQIVESMTSDEAIIAAAYLHDVLEDTKTKAQELRTLFGERVTMLVEEESEDREEGMDKASTWHRRKKETIDGLKSASRDIQMIALGDKLSNMRSTKREYDAIGDALWARFNETRKSEHAWYYKGVTTALGDLKDTKAWEELHALTESVFGKI